MQLRPKDSSGGGAQTPPDSPRGTPTETLARLERPVPACAVLERNKSIQIREAARTISRDERQEPLYVEGDHCQVRESGSDDGSSMQSQGVVDIMESERSPASQQSTSVGEAVPLTSHVRRRVNRQEALDLDVFLTVASDWQALDPRLLTFDSDARHRCLNRTVWKRSLRQSAPCSTATMLWPIL